MMTTKILISILGTTAVGKTSFALKLAEQTLSLPGSENGKEKFAGFQNDKNLGKKRFAGVDLISADSRQVYKGLEILSGADVPEGFKRGVDAVFPGKNNAVFSREVGVVSSRENDIVFPFFKKGAINLHGVSNLELTDEWSVAHFKSQFRCYYFWHHCKTSSVCTAICEAQLNQFGWRVQGLGRTHTT